VSRTWLSVHERPRPQDRRRRCENRALPTSAPLALITGPAGLSLLSITARDTQLARGFGTCARNTALRSPCCAQLLNVRAAAESARGCPTLAGKVTR
jgi:hypothetical protein